MEQTGTFPLFGTLTMNTLGRLDDGTIVSLWTNTMALPENATAGNGTWEDVFTNRDSHHIAMSGDEGKTWYGFREIILDEHRNHPGYATLDGPEDRGKHQSEMVQLDKNRILISLGQHKNHRRLVIVDRRWVGAKTRATQTGKDSDSQWTIHTYIPQKKGHCSYNRKPSAELVPDPSGSTKKVLQIKRLNDPELVNENPMWITGTLELPGTFRTGPQGWSNSASVQRTGIRRMIPAFRSL